MYNKTDIKKRANNTLVDLISMLVLQIISFSCYMLEKTQAGLYIVLFALLCPFPYYSYIKENIHEYFSAYRLVIINIKELKVKLKKYIGKKYRLEDIVFLGFGYEFKPHHTRALYELLDNGLKGAKFKAHGSNQIHKIEQHNNKAMYFYQRDLTGHTLLLGTTGAGKTRFLDLLICQAIYKDECVVIIDPKSDKDLRAKIINACKAFNRESDYKELNLFDSASSIKLNPIGSFNRPTEVGDRLISMVPKSSGSDTFRAYANSAVSAAVALLMLNKKVITLRAIRDIVSDHMQYTKGAEQYLSEYSKSLNNLNGQKILQYLMRLGAGVNKAKRALSANDLHEVYKYAINTLDENNQPLMKQNGNFEMVLLIAKMDKAFYQKVTSSILPPLNALCSGNLSELLSSTIGSKSMQNLIHENRVLYVSLHCLLDSTLGSYLGKLLLSDLSEIAGISYSRLDKFKRVNIFIDEASEVANEAMVQLLNKSRGANFAIYLATQSIDDFTVKTSSQSGANQIIANCNNLISLRIKGKSTANIITDNLPKTTVPMFKSSIGFNENNSLSINTNVSRSISHEYLSVFPDEALSILPDFEYIAKLSDGRLLKGKIPLIVE